MRAADKSASASRSHSSPVWLHHGGREGLSTSRVNAKHSSEGPVQRRDQIVGGARGPGAPLMSFTSALGPVLLQHQRLTAVQRLLLRGSMVRIRLTRGASLVRPALPECDDMYASFPCPALIHTDASSCPFCMYASLTVARIAAAGWPSLLCVLGATRTPLQQRCQWV